MPVVQEAEADTQGGEWYRRAADKQRAKIYQRSYLQEKGRDEYTSSVWWKDASYPAVLERVYRHFAPPKAEGRS